MRSSPALASVLLVLVTAACAGPLEGGPASQPMTGSVAPTADGAAPDDGASVVQAYGEQHATQFAGVYIDQPGGDLVALFTQDLATHQEALDALLGGPGHVRVVPATFTEETLLDLQERIASAGNELATGNVTVISVAVDVIRNVVLVTAKSDNRSADELLRAYGPVGAIEVDLYPADKPWSQPREGSGWRLLGVGDTGLTDGMGLAYAVALFTDAPTVAAEWTRDGLPGKPGAWDPDREVVVLLSYGIGSSCPELRLDDLVLDAGARLVYGEVSDPFEPRACTADLVGAKTFVVAVLRTQLPPSPFTLRLRAEPIGCEPDCGAVRPASLEVDLR